MKDFALVLALCLLREPCGNFKIDSLPQFAYILTGTAHIAPPPPSVFVAVHDFVKSFKNGIAENEKKRVEEEKARERAQNAEKKRRRTNQRELARMQADLSHSEGGQPWTEEYVLSY